MNTHLLALQLMAFQGCLGAFDTLYHHELTEALPGRPSARLELSIHSVRSLIYSALFIGLAVWAFHGVWAKRFLLALIIPLRKQKSQTRKRLFNIFNRLTHGFHSSFPDIHMNCG